MTPLAPRKSHKTLAVGISLIWSLGTIAALPAALFSRLYRVRRCGGSCETKPIKIPSCFSDVDEKKIYSCILIFPDGLPGQSHLDYMWESLGILIYVDTLLNPGLNLAFSATISSSSSSPTSSRWLAWQFAILEWVRSSFRMSNALNVKQLLWMSRMTSL